MPASDARGLRAPLEALMRDAGNLARATAQRAFKRWTKGPDHSPVSEADIAVNDLLRARLAQLAPGAGWLSEEPEDDPDARAAPALWIVDPIDGTRAYLAGRLDWVISVALVENGRPLLGAIFAPATDHMFLAARGQGATVNGAPVAAIGGSGLGGARLAGPKRMLERIAVRQPDIVAEPKVYSLALRLARIAQGTLDAVVVGRGSRDWDLAAADLLVHEAGGAMTDLSGRPLTYNRPHLGHGALVAAGPARHRALVDLVRDLSPEFA